MLRNNIFALLCLLAPICFAQNCPPGYTTNDNKMCYRVYPNLATRSDAALKCFADGGYLASVPNGFANSYIASLASNAGAFVWLGVQCYNGDKSTCVNDDQSTFGPYQPWAPGNPSTFGTCVYLSLKSPTNLQWVSFDCSASFAYVCEYSLGPQCPAGYSLNGNTCYKAAIPGKNAVNAELDCKKDCGHLASINSVGENSFVTSLTTANAVGSGVIRIGLKSLPTLNQYTHYWLDGSPYNYSRIEFDDTEVGSCYVLALQNGIVSKGSWANDNCEDSLPYICKTAPGTCTPSPTLSPPTCGGTQYYNDYGSIYSPGYPTGYGITKCVNFIATQQGTYVKLAIGELLLDSYATIQLFNSIADSAPFATITSATPVNSTYRSLENGMVVVFTANVQSAGRWKLNYSTGTTGGTVPVANNTLCPTRNYLVFKAYIFKTYLQVNQFVALLEINNNYLTAFGLRCPNIKSDGDRSSCQWDDLTSFNYNAFKSTHPLSTYGPGCCDFNHGRWDSCYTCTTAFNAYICEAPALGK